MDHFIPEEFREIQALTRRFVEQELRPHEATVDREGVLPLDLRRRLCKRAVEVGLFAFNMPQSAGGPGLPRLAQVLIREGARHLIGTLELKSHIEFHLHRLLALTNLKALQWINLNHSKIECTTITKLSGE